MKYSDIKGIHVRLTAEKKQELQIQLLKDNKTLQEWFEEQVDKYIKGRE